MCGENFSRITSRRIGRARGNPSAGTFDSLRGCVKSRGSVHGRHGRTRKECLSFRVPPCFPWTILPSHRQGGLFTQSLRGCTESPHSALKHDILTQRRGGKERVSQRVCLISLCGTLIHPLRLCDEIRLSVHTLRHARLGTAVRGGCRWSAGQQWCGSDCASRRETGRRRVTDSTISRSGDSSPQRTESD